MRKWRDPPNPGWNIHGHLSLQKSENMFFWWKWKTCLTYSNTYGLEPPHVGDALWVACLCRNTNRLEWYMPPPGTTRGSRMRFLCPMLHEIDAQWLARPLTPIFGVNLVVVICAKMKSSWVCFEAVEFKEHVFSSTCPFTSCPCISLTVPHIVINSSSRF